MPLTAVLAAGFFASSAAAAATLSGNVFGTLDWSNGPYQVTGNITVPLGQTLTLSSGTIIKFNSGLGLTVNGTLIADGTPAAPVTLTSIADDSVGGDTGGDGPTVGAPGQWNAVTFSGTGSSGSRLSNTSISFGQQVALTGASPQFNGVSIATMSVIAISLDLTSSPSGTGNTAYGSPLNGMNVPSGSISTVLVWHDIGIPYVIRSGRVSVSSPGSLTIEAGTVVKALGNVGGSNGVLNAARPLIAAGTQADPVVFTSLKDDTAGGDTNDDGAATLPGRGDWQGLVMAGGGSLSWTSIRYGGMSNSQGTPPAGLYIQSNPAALSDVTVSSSSAAGVYSNGGGAVTDGTFDHNAAQGLDLESGAVSTMTGVEFTGNGADGLYVGDAQAYVNGSTFAFNGAYGADAVGANGTLWIATAAFTSNAAGAARMHPQHDFKLTGAVTAAGGPLLGVDVIGTTLAAPRTWRRTPLPYVIRSGRVSVSNPGSLTIEAGTVIKALGNVGGSNGVLNAARPLIAAGTQADPVVFTSLKDDTAGGDTNDDGAATLPGRGDWQGLVMAGGGSLSWTSIRYGGMSNNQSTPPAGLYIQSNPAALSDVEISSSSAVGLYNNGGGTVTDGVFDHNAAQGLDLESGAVSTMTGVEFTGNGADGLYVGDAQAYVNGSTFAYNGAYGADAVGANGTLWIATAAFTANAAGAVRMHPQHDFKLTGAVTAAGGPLLGVDVIGTTLAAPRTWRRTPLPYVIRSGRVSVSNPGSLTIEAGTVIKALGNVGGSNGVLNAARPLIAAGTQADPVVFTSLKDDTAGGDTNDDGAATLPGRGDWQGLVMAGGGSLSWTSIRYGGMLNNQGTPPAGLYIQSNPAALSDVEISSSSAVGLYNNGGGTVTDGTFDHNAAQGLDLESGAVSTMTGVAFTGNGADGLYVGDAQAYVNGSTFAFNGSYGADATGANGTLWIATAAFTSNAAGAARMHPQHDFKLTGAVTASGGPLLGVDVIGTTLAAPRTWRRTPLPYVIRAGRVSVSSPGSLTIEAGTVVKALGNTGGSNGVLNAARPLIAAGTQADPVVFTSLKDDTVGGDTNDDGAATVPGRGDWQGLVMAGGGSLSWTSIRYGGMSNNQGTPPAGLYIQSNPSALSDVEVSSSSAVGLYNNGGGAVTDGVFDHNAAQGLDLESGAVSTMTGVEFTGNGADGLYVGDAQAYVNGSTFAFNGAYGADAGGANGTLWIATAAFTSNASGAVRMVPQANIGQSGTLSASGSPYNGIDIAAGSSAQPRTWQKGLPYIVRQGEVVFTGGTGLTLQAGAVIKFKGVNNGTLGRLRLQSGALHAQGTASAPVVLTSLLDDAYGGDTNGDGSATSPAPGDWHGLRLFAPSALNTLDHTVIRYSGALTAGSQDLGVYVSNSTATITNSQLTFAAGAGAYAESGASLNILNTDIKNDADGVRSYDSKVLLANCAIAGNSSHGVNAVSSSQGPVQAANNWWGAASGPTTATNPGGTGDAVTANVVYSPFLGAEPSNALPAVISTSLLDPNPVRPGGMVRLRAFFNKDMNAQVLPSASYGLSSPYSTYGVSGGTWTSNSIFEAATTLPAAAPDGTYTLLLTGAVDFAANQIAPSTFVFYTVDGTPPAPPTLSSATPRAGGAVALSWTAAGGEASAVYAVYRATDQFTTAAEAVRIATVTATSYTDLPDADGAYVYAVAARDAAGNESALSSRLASFSLRAAPSAPADLAGTFDPALKQIALTWGAPSTGTAASYNVYRSSALLANATATAYVDHPAADAVLFYQVAALDALGNLSARSTGTSVAFDVHAPTITVSRVSDGQYTSGNLTPSIAITDFSPFTSTSTLNGQPFISTVAIYQSLNQTVSEGQTASLSCSTGTIQRFTSVWATSCNNPHNCGSCPIDGTSCTVIFDNAHCGDVAPGCSKDGRLAIDCGVPGVTLTQPGTYFLSIQAQDAYANASSATLHFTIDKASPTIVLQSPADGLITNQNVIVAFTATDDLTPANQLVVKNELGAVVASTYAITTEGTHSLTLTARDLAGNAASAGAVFILDKTPPAAVTDLRFVSQDKAQGQATLAWTAPHDALSGTAGYLIKTATFPITSANFASATTIDYSSAPLADGSTEQFVVAVTTSRTSYFALKSSDAAGNFSPISNSPFWDFDGPLLAGLNPAPGAVVSRPGTITVQASDLSGVAQVVFSVDGVVLSTVTTPPYSFLWNTLAYADGSHALAFIALDSLGNASSLAASYTLVYQPPPSPTIAFPPNNYTTRSATITVTGIAPIGTTVQILVDGFVLGSAPVSSTGSYAGSVFLPVQGTPLLTVTASDAKGSSSQSSPVAVNYNLDPPGGPLNFAAVSAPAGHVALSWTAPSGKTPSFYNVYRSTYSEAFSSSAVPSPVFLARASVTAVGFNDVPPLDGVYYYGATSLDSSGDESGLSDIASAVSDRVVPSAALIFVGTTPPLGLGAWPLQLTLSKPLALAPLLLFTPAGQSPINVTLSPSSPTVWVGTLTVVTGMHSGPGAFSFQGTDYVGNVGTVLTSGSSAAIDLAAPVGSIVLTPPSPEKAGSVALALTLSKPAVSTPTLAYVTAAGSTVPVTLSGSGTSWSGTLMITSGADGAASFVFSAADGLGNVGTILNAGANFAILTTPPGTPLFLRAIPQPAGGVHLTWSAPVSGTPASYDVYRDGVRISSGILPLSDGSGAYNDAPTDGSYDYSASAVDAAGNESAQTTPIAALSKSTLPSAPVASTATLTAFGHVEVGWQSGSADSVSYKVYRTTAAITNLNIPITTSLSTSVFSSLASTPPYVDTPPQNALYYYYLTAFDVAGNQSLPSAPATILWDRSPPTIVIAGVQEGSVYNHDVAPVFTATGSASAITASATLNAAAFVSGSTVSAEGDYTLTVNAVNQSNGSSTSTVHFTLDKTSPTVAITGVPTGTSHSSILPQVTVTDLHLAAVTLTLDGGAYSQGTPIAANGDHVFAVNARDAAGNVTISSVPFSLNIPPTTPGNFTMAAVDGVGATFSWQSPASGLAGYRFYRDGVLLSQGLLTGLQFQDASFTLGAAHLYEVSAVDASGQEGGRSQLSVPAATFQLASYGANVNGVAALTRGFFDTVNLQYVNSGSQSLLIGPATVELISSTATIFTGQVPSASVSAGASAVVPAVVATPSTIADAPSLRVTLQLPSGLGTHATIAKTFTLAARTPLGTAVELYAGPMIYDANASVQVKFNNKGSAPLEIRTAINSDVGVSLATPQGTVLSNASLSQTADGAQTGSGVYFVSIGPGASFLFDAVPVFVPSALGSSAVLSAHIGQAYNGLAGSQPIQGTQSYDASQTITGVSAPAYTATISPDRSVYDQGSTMLLSGVAQDASNSLVPGATVQVGISVQSYSRSLSTMTDATGHYSLTFNPAPTEAGVYTLWATNPSVVSHIPQSSFTIVGFSLQYSNLSIAAVQNATKTFTVGLNNTGQTVLSSMTVQIISTVGVTGVNLTMDPASLPASLGGGQSANLAFSAIVYSTAALGSVPFTVTVTDPHGFVRTMPVIVAVSAAVPNPSVSPQTFTIGMNGGQVRPQTIVLKNTGTRAWTGVTVSTPALSWVSLVGNLNPSQPLSLGDIAPGGQAQFVLSVAPPTDQPSQAYALNPLVQINSANSQTLPINALITITAGTSGGVVYNVINADKPRDQFGSGVPVPGAAAQLVSLDIAGLSFSATVDANSVARFNDIPSGNYSLSVKGAGFSDYNGTETIQPGVVNTREILMLTQLVSYTWSVTPTTIVDQYSLTLSLTYKTDVPAPVVIISPSVFNFDIPSGGSADGQMTITNQGIISAFNVNPMPTINDPHMTIDFPYSTIPELKAGQTITVPFHVALHSPNICYQGNVDWSGGYTCAAGNAVTALWPGFKVNVNCGAPPSVVTPDIPGLQLPASAITGVLPGAPLVSAAVAAVVAPAAPPASGCTCSMNITGPDTLPPLSTSTTYQATLSHGPNCGGCNLSCDLGASWTATDDLKIVSQAGCTAQVQATGLKGGKLAISKSVAPICTPGNKAVAGCQPQLTASQSPPITVTGGSPITFTVTTPPGCPAQTIAWSAPSSPVGIISPASGLTTTFTPGTTGTLTIMARDTTPGSTLSVSTMVAVATVTFIGTSGHDTVGGDAFDRNAIAQGINSTIQLFPTLPNPITNVTATVLPADVFTLAPSGIPLVIDNPSVVNATPSVLTSAQTTLALQAVGTGGTTLRAVLPGTSPLEVGNLGIASFGTLTKSVVIHIVRDTAGHDASATISPADIQNIMTTDTKNVKSAWTQANIDLEPYGLTTLPTFTADVVTVSTPFGASVIFTQDSDPDYLNILAAAPPVDGSINLYYVHGLNGGADDGATIPGRGISIISVVHRVSLANVTAHEIGHGLGLVGGPCGPPEPMSDYCDANRTYELMYFQDPLPGSVLTYRGFTITPAQGLIVNPP